MTLTTDQVVAQLAAEGHESDDIVAAIDSFLAVEDRDMSEVGWTEGEVDVLRGQIASYDPPVMMQVYASPAPHEQGPTPDSPREALDAPERFPRDSLDGLTPNEVMPTFAEGWHMLELTQGGRVIDTGEWYWLAQGEATPLYYSTTDVARLAHVKEQTVRMWRSRGLMPAPDIMLGGRPGWRHPKVTRWLTDTGRLPHQA